MKNKIYIVTIFLFMCGIFVLVGCKEPDPIHAISSYKFSVGDILFSDGTYIKATDVCYGIPEEQVSKAIAVISAITSDGRTLGVGLYKGKDLSWATKESLGYKTNFEKIRAEDSGSIKKGFTFSGDKNGSDNWNYICSIDSEGTDDAEINYPAFNFAQTYGKTARLEETDFEDGWYVPTVYELYEMYKNSEVIQNSLKLVKGLSIIEGYNQSSYWTSSQSSAFENNAFQINFENGYVDDFYYKDEAVNVVVFKQFFASNFTQFNYKQPSIKSIKIPPAVEGFTGELKISIRGENLKGYAITCDYSEVLNVEYLSDEEVLITIMCKGIAGEYDVKVSCGLASKVGVLKIGQVKTYNVGDIILADGSKISVDDIGSYSINANNKPIGVCVSSLYGGTTGKIMGLQKGRAVWAYDRTEAMNNAFEKISVTFAGDKIQGYTFGGDLIGADNWDYICSVDPEGTKSPETNYPVFNFALTYGKTANLMGTDYESGWYIPSIVELRELYTKIDIIQKSLTAAGGCELAPLRTGCYFLSSSTIENKNFYIFNIGLYEGDVWDEAWKGNESNVLVLRDF